ncbi:hypothetical protein PSP6_160262 [Paraburkholderia tropica]|nr:hypothetical protein PSP6_160262 [Paraburkholderia tropica]
MIGVVANAGNAIAHDRDKATAARTSAARLRRAWLELLQDMRHLLAGADVAATNAATAACGESSSVSLACRA